MSVRNSKKNNHVEPAISAGVSPPLCSRHCLRIPDAAVYISASNWFVEELIRNGFPFREFGKYRTLDADDLDAWVLRQEKKRITKIVSGKTFTERVA